MLGYTSFSSFIESRNVVCQLWSVLLWQIFQNHWKYVYDINLIHLCHPVEMSPQMVLDNLDSWVLCIKMPQNQAKCYSLAVTFMRNTPPPIPLNLSVLSGWCWNSLTDSAPCRINCGGNKLWSEVYSIPLLEIACLELRRILANQEV